MPVCWLIYLSIHVLILIFLFELIIVSTIICILKIKRIRSASYDKQLMKNHHCNKKSRTWDMSNSFQLCLFSLSLTSFIGVEQCYCLLSVILICRALIGHLLNPRAVYLFGSLDSVKAKNRVISCTERTSFFDR